MGTINPKEGNALYRSVTLRQQCWPAERDHVKQACFDKNLVSGVSEKAISPKNLLSQERQDSRAHKQLLSHTSVLCIASCAESPKLLRKANHEFKVGAILEERNIFGL